MTYGHNYICSRGMFLIKKKKKKPLLTMNVNCTWGEAQVSLQIIKLSCQRSLFVLPYLIFPLQESFTYSSSSSF